MRRVMAIIISSQHSNDPITKKAPVFLENIQRGCKYKYLTFIYKVGL